ncbi:SIR2 family protein [Mycolicibacterium neoaurum]|uniref:SIR2 family protein n=1 Tax=Mycolicibacterium neoaurum TaxID=1795 RepID=UPI001BCE6257|nr:SIR2 family protein [Mycolicibacterium neoaurum]QVI26772.1 SIR2 family protein [Mycolicibacterium neoaurum]
MAGHLLVLRGDLKRLVCDAILIPCDIHWNVVTKQWGDLLDLDEFERSLYGHSLKVKPKSPRWADVSPHNGRRVRLVATASDQKLDAQWVADGVVGAISDFANKLSLSPGRIKPLVTLPIVGAGAGGFRHRRGALLKALLPALQTVARDADIDVALVLFHERDHAAVQNLRVGTDWNEFNHEELHTADELRRRAANRELSLFLGSGVSVPLGLPDWRGLLTELNGGKLTDYSPADAPAIAQRIADRLGADHLHDRVAALTDVSDVSPAHLLLAGLGVRRNVTTNYDLAYESALEGRLTADGFRTLSRELATESRPWLLKMHGDAGKPTTIVLTTDDYVRLESDYRSVLSVVETLMLTSHLMFVGYSLEDDDFTAAGDRVRQVRALADTGADAEFATVLALHPDAVKQQSGFRTVPMLAEPDTRTAARRLEIFLDRVSWAAARADQRSHAHLLDDHYDDLFTDDAAATRLRELLAPLANLDPGDPARKCGAWERVESLLTDLGADPPP